MWPKARHIRDCPGAERRLAGAEDQKAGVERKTKHLVHLKQEEKFREINSMIVNSAPSSVAAYIRGLYGNAVWVPGTLYRPGLHARSARRNAWLSQLPLRSTTST